MEMIVAMSKKRGIGKQNQLVWNIPEDLKYFSRMTRNCIVIMGYHTYLSLPDKFRPLPNRLNIVLTRNPTKIFEKDLLERSDTLIFSTVEDVPRYIKDYEKEYPKCFVIGGEQIYSLFIDQVEYLHITHIEKEYDCDAFFPEYETKFNLLETSERQWSNNEQCHFTHKTYQKLK